MGIVIAFKSDAAGDNEPELDLLTAVDIAIRDLRDISRRWGENDAREQAEACLAMLERTFNAAV